MLVDLVQLNGAWLFRRRSIATCRCRPFTECCQETGSDRQFVIWFAMKSRGLEQRAHRELLVRGERDVLDAELRHADFCVVKLLRSRWLAIVLRGQVTRCNQNQDRTVDRIARPSVWRRGEVFANVAPLFAGANV